MKPINFEPLKYSVHKNIHKSEFRRRALSASKLNNHETKVELP
jgi:hypothetical protein